MEMLSFKELLWLFFVYSFAGWVIETAAQSLITRRFANRGFATGPFCFVYGLSAVLITIFLQDAPGVWIFIFTAVSTTVVEWVAGHLIEKVTGERWWDYSKIRWNLDGYICLYATVAGGAIGYAVIKWLNPLLCALFAVTPTLVMNIILIVLSVICGIDILASYMLQKKKSGRLEKWGAMNNRFANVSARLVRAISNYMERRHAKAYPKSKKIEAKKKDSSVFAAGCGFYKIVMLFFIGSFLGDITETIFCRVVQGVWMSRSSVVIGPFSVVWGFAFAFGTALLYKYIKKSDGFVFFIGTLLGGVYEYGCSVFTEIVFGTVFWDYSYMPFNLGGRINLLYCFFWGIAAVIWLKKLYPVISRLIEKIPAVAGKIVTWCIVVFMLFNLILSSMALYRYSERVQKAEPSYSWERWIDEHYDDEKMERIYPNMILTQ